MLFTALATVFGVLAFIAWAVAVVSWILAIQHRAEGVSMSTLMFQGFKSFDPDSFNDAGKKHQSRFLKALGAFFVLVLLTGAVSALSASG